MSTPTNPTRMTEAELAAQAQAAAEAQAATEAAAAQAAAEEQAAAEAAAAQVAADTQAAADKAAASERDRVTGLFALVPAGSPFSAARDEAIKSGSSVSVFSALLAGVKAAKDAERTSAIDDDTQANASVKPGKGAAEASAIDAAVNAILFAGTDKAGKK